MNNADIESLYRNMSPHTRSLNAHLFQTHTATTPLNAEKTTKYRNKKVVYEGKKFDSEGEFKRWKFLNTLVFANEIKSFIWQVPFELPGNIKYFADFVIIKNDERIRVEDFKGFLNRVSHNKIKQVQEIYKIKVHIIKKYDEVFE